MPRKTNDFKADLPFVHRALHEWYATAGRRDLPWRNTQDPYAVYISEIMLQQTQVKTVLERFYHPFLAQFPTLAALAAAPSQHVMKAWEGLGYYTRARNLHAAAQQCAPTLPDSPEALRALPGRGRNTANAVACFGFKHAVPVMEANVKRIIARLYALTTLDEKTLWHHAEALLDRKNPFDYNQAMMDIGALVCTKRNPRCGECPLARICQGKDTPEAYPAPKQAKQTPVRERAIIVFQNPRGEFYIHKRTERFLGGLYGFVECDTQASEAPCEGKPHPIASARVIGQVTQAYSHFTLQATIYLQHTSIKLTRSPESARFVPLAQLTEFPLSRADIKIVDLLNAYLESIT